MPNTSKRGFASMDGDKQRLIASKGGKAAHAKGTAHEWSSEEARAAGRKGGESRGTRGREGGEFVASSNFINQAGSSLRSQSEPFASRSFNASSPTTPTTNTIGDFKHPIGSERVAQNARNEARPA
jgi:hypothetical protein